MMMEDVLECAKGDVIVEDGTPADKFYLVKSGTFSGGRKGGNSGHSH